MPDRTGVRPSLPLQPPLELWGGVECSTVRVSDRWRDQVHETGHDRRAGDLERIAALGIGTLRFPILWERVTRGHPRACGWAWHDRRLGELRRRGVAIVGGLLHHGSGPDTTDLLDPGFPALLAVHAAAAAARYPFVLSWTPVNEPMTTARFSCLYGYWFPHGRDTGAFLRALANQCRAVLLAMRAIRAAIPGALLVQTEDFGRTFGATRLRVQADYENERRWLSLDLLTGRVDAAHPWRARLEEAGVPARDLDELLTGEATPDIVGVNHYVTSDRYLDDRTELYPPHMHGGNGRSRYVDLEATRADLVPGTSGWATTLRAVWDRYGLPLAVTEAHLGCDDEREQVRWLMEAWEAAIALRAEGADVRAVTAWAMFGLVDWDSLLREPRGRYEPGVFDVRHDPPRPTLLADAVRGLASDGRFAHPALLTPGWWRRDDRLHPAFRRVAA